MPTLYFDHTTRISDASARFFGAFLPTVSGSVEHASTALMQYLRRHIELASSALLLCFWVFQLFVFRVVTVTVFAN